VLTALQGISNLIRDWNRVEEGLKVPDEIDIDIEALRRAEEEYAKTHSPRQ
jgi:hypothetical protein